MRATHRGIKEMDIIFGKWAERRLETAAPDVLDLFEEMLEEADQDLYGWASGKPGCPDRYRELLTEMVAEVSAS